MRKKIEILGTSLIAIVMLAGCGSSNSKDSSSELSSASIVTESSIIEDAASIDTDFILENMCFQIAGNTYSIGANTLGEMIDNGCSISEDIGTIKAGENAEYTIILNDTWSVSVTVKNNTDVDVSAKDCTIVGINAPIYQTESDNLILFTNDELSNVEIRKVDESSGSTEKDIIENSSSSEYYN